MDAMKTTWFLLLFGLALSPIGYAQSLKVNVIAVESVDDFKTWLGVPVDVSRAESGAMPMRFL